MASDPLAFLAYFALAAIFYAPILAGLRAFPPGDFTEYFVPFSLFQRSEWLAGRLPLWNPFTYSGHPFLADVQAAIFYPVSNLLLALTLPWGSPAARLYWLQVEAVLHIALAGCFTYVLARDLLRHRGAAFLAGCVFAFSGYLTGYPPLQLAVLRSAIWLPLVLWLLLRAFDLPGCWRWWLAASLAYAVAFLAGHPQTFLFLSYAVASWILALLIAVVRNLMSHRSQLPVGAYLGRVAVFYIFFLGLSAAQLWPSLEFMGLSVRARVDYAFVSGGFPLRDTWQMLLPGVLSLFSPLYVGLAALGLAILGTAKAASRLKPMNSITTTVLPPTTGAEPVEASAQDSSPTAFRQAQGSFATKCGCSTIHRAELYFIILALLTLLVSYGNHGFLYPVFYRWAPGWALFRDQERAAYLVAFGLSMLAGYGAAALATLSARQRRGIGLAWAAVALAGLIGVGLSLRPAGSDVPLRQVAFGVIILLAWVSLLWRHLAEPRRLGLLTALVLVDLLAVNIATNLAPRQPIPAAEAAAVRAAVMEHPQAAEGMPGRAFNDGVLAENYGMTVLVEDLTGSSPLRLARYAALLSGFPRDRLWRLTGVSHVLSRQSDLYVASKRLAEFPGAGGAAFLYQLKTAHPRAWVVNAVRVAGDAQALPLLGDASFDPEQTALLPPHPPAGLEEGILALPGTNSVRLERLAPNALRARVESEHGGLLVVSENWLPGWRATEQRAGEGPRRLAPVLRADLTLLAVPVKPGESAIELVYWPDSVRFGLMISGATLLLMGLVALISERTHRGGVIMALAVPGNLLRRIAGVSRRVRVGLGIAAGVLIPLAGWAILSTAPLGGAGFMGEREPPAVAALRVRYTWGWPADRVRLVQIGTRPQPWRGGAGPAAWLTLVSDAAGAVREITALVEQDVQRLVVASQADPAGREDVRLAAVAKEYLLLAETPAGDWRVQVYGRPPAHLPSVDAPFAAGLHLTGAAIPAAQWVGGDVVPVYLRWEGPASALNGNEKLTLQLLDARGKLVAQADQPFGAAELVAAMTGYSLGLPRFLDPGLYRLIAALYDPSKPGAPRLLTTAGADHVELAILPAR